MAWTSVELFDDRTMVGFAARRAIVRIAPVPGQRRPNLAKLVDWPHPDPARRVNGRTARVETRAGTRFRVKCEQIQAVDDDRSV